MRTSPRRALLLMLAAALPALCAPQGARAQSAGAETVAPQFGPAEGSGPARARKVEEFGRLYGCSGGARLDYFALELQNEPGSTGYIVARDARGKLPAAAHAWGAYVLRYFVEMRGVDESRLVLVDGAAVGGDELKMELWLVPPGAEPPRVEPPGKDDARPFVGKYAGLEVFDETSFYDADGPSAGSFGDAVLLSAYAGLLKKQPDSQGFLVVYSPPGAAPGYWRRAGTRERQKISGAGLAPERLTVINGGALPVKAKTADAEGAEETYGSVELWVGAKGAPPVRHVEEDSALTGALLIGGESFFSEEGAAAEWLLNGLADTLRANGRSVGCIVVYPGDGSGVPTGEGGADEPAPDVFKMARSWKDALLKKHGFEPQRVLILSGPPQESGAGRLDVWAVPPGAPLPDPFAEDAPDDGGEEGGKEGVDAEDGEAERPPPTVRQSGVNLRWQ